jgi:hypothetical protein
MKHPILRPSPDPESFRGWWSEHSVRVLEWTAMYAVLSNKAGQLQVMPSSASTTAADPSLMAATPFSAPAVLALGGA